MAPYVQFSRYQWGLLKILKRRVITDEEALFIDQRPFNSLCRRDMIGKNREGYYLSQTGYDILENYEHTEVTKSHASPNLGKYVAMMKSVRVMKAAS
jgi:hypothetical protein